MTAKTEWVATLTAERDAAFAEMNRKLTEQDTRSPNAQVFPIGPREAIHRYAEASARLAAINAAT